MAKNTVDVTDATFDSDVLKSDKPVARRLLGRPGAARARWSPRCSTRSRARTRTRSPSPSSTSTPTRTTARDYQVMSIPTMIVFQDGKPVKQIVGAKPKAALLSDLADYLG